MLIPAVLFGSTSLLVSHMVSCGLTPKDVFKLVKEDDKFKKDYKLISSTIVGVIGAIECIPDIHPSVKAVKKMSKLIVPLVAGYGATVKLITDNNKLMQIK